MLLKLGVATEAGSYHQFLASLVFAAFATEAFLNHVGPLVHPSWSGLDYAPSRKKLNAITSALNIPVNFEARPWKIFPELIGIRNTIAHGRSEELEDEIAMSPDAYEAALGIMVEADWQSYSTQAKVEHARQEIEALFRIIWLKAGFNEHKLFMFGLQEGSAFLAESPSIDS